MTISLDAKKIVRAMNLLALIAFFLIFSTDAFSQVRRRRTQTRLPSAQSENEIIKAKLFGQVVHGPTILNIENIISHQNPRQRLYGQNLKAVVIKAQNLNYYGRGSVQLLINNRPVGGSVRLGLQSDKIVIPVQGRSIVGRDIQSIKLQVQGTIKLKMLGLKVKRQSLIIVNTPTRRRRY